MNNGEMMDFLIDNVGRKLAYSMKEKEACFLPYTIRRTDSRWKTEMWKDTKLGEEDIG